MSFKTELWRGPAKWADCVRVRLAPNWTRCLYPGLNRDGCAEIPFEQMKLVVILESDLEGDRPILR